MIDRFLFHMTTQNHQNVASLHALDLAENYDISDLTEIKVHRIARRICTEGYNMFSDNLRETFPTAEYEDLVILAIESSQGDFFYNLRMRVETILSSRLIFTNLN